MAITRDNRSVHQWDPQGQDGTLSVLYRQVFSWDEAAFLRQGFPCFFIGSGGFDLQARGEKCNLCRTQIRAHCPGGTDYFTKNPIANHQHICCGDHVELIRRFYDLF